VRKCPYCRSFNGAVKKLPGLFRLVHEARTKDAREERAELIAVEFSEAMSANKQLKEHMGKMTHDLTPLVVQALFLRIPDEDCLLLNLDISRGARPEDMIVRQFLVPPACIRPSVTMGTSGSNEDDLTVKIADIIFINNAIKNAIDKGAQPAVIIENCKNTRNDAMANLFAIILVLLLTMHFFSFVPSCPAVSVVCRGLFAAASEYVLQFRLAWFPQVAGHQADSRAHSTTQGKDGTLPGELQVRVFFFLLSLFFFFLLLSSSLLSSGKRQARPAG